MSFRIYQIAASALLLASLSGVSLAGEACSQSAQTTQRTVAGHPGKSLLLPKRSVCKAAKSKAVKSKPMILASYTDALGGQALVNGRTERALEQMFAKKSTQSSAEELTNQCVAHTVLRQWPQARDACDAAVAGALDKRAEVGKTYGTQRMLATRAVGVAYSNRAVMYWLLDDAAAAHNDLAEARALTPAARYVLRNSDVAKSSPSLARTANVSID